MGSFDSCIRSIYNQRLSKLCGDLHNCRSLLLFPIVTQHQNTMHAFHRFGVFFQVASMFQDPSIGEIKVYYVVTTIIVFSSTLDQVRIETASMC